MRSPLPSPPNRRRPRRRGVLASVETLEGRVLLSTLSGLHEVELVGRASDGAWWASGYIVGDAHGMQHEVFSRWDAGVDWRHVRSGDFDGDGLGDVAGWDADTGNWWVSLSDMVGSTVVLGANWSPAGGWADVAAADLAGPEDRAADPEAAGHFVNKSDLVGRDAWGNWWAAVSNGDGTFTTTLLTTWSTATAWRDVRFLDTNGDGATDVAGRDDWGNWWYAESRGGLAYETRFAASWTEQQEWRDVLVVENFFGDGRDAIAGRGVPRAGIYQGQFGFWSLIPFVESATPGVSRAGFRAGFSWVETGGWRDVRAADLDDDGRDEIIGRTSAGQWWSTEYLHDGFFTQRPIGSWAEAAGWRDVQVARVRGVAADVPAGSLPVEEYPVTDALVGRASDGGWWLSKLDPATGQLADHFMGAWNEAAGWRDVHAAHVTRSPVAFTVPPPGVVGFVSIDIRGHRLGTEVTIVDDARTRFAGTLRGVTVTYTVPATGYTTSVFVGVPSFSPVDPDRNQWTVRFEGHVGRDEFLNSSVKIATARGWAGDDSFDARNGVTSDQLFGGNGLDELLGDPGDVLVQD